MLIDEELALDAGSLTTSLTLGEQQRIKYILLTHAHHDHIKDVPSFSLNLYMRNLNIDIYATTYVINALETNLFNGNIYPEFHKLPAEKPTICYKQIVPLNPVRINNHEIIPLQVKHGKNTVGYHIKNNTNKTVFYTADTGPHLTKCWEYISPQILIIEVTLPNRYGEFALTSEHLTPGLLYEELVRFEELKHYIPEIIITHMDPELENEIEDEVKAIAEKLKAHVTFAREGLQITV
ncbi:MAG: MBL fold metallo-hydrolase [Dehalococcoidia bacterium]